MHIKGDAYKDREMQIDVLQRLLSFETDEHLKYVWLYRLLIASYCKEWCKKLTDYKCGEICRILPPPLHSTVVTLYYLSEAYYSKNNASVECYAKNLSDGAIEVLYKLLDIDMKGDSK